jgi:predicted nuclease with TOPRIM domain
MIPTKTYPLSAIMGGEISDKERIKELTDAFNRVCDENADFVAESIKADRRVAELEAQLKHAEGHAAELEAEVKALRESGVGLVNFLDEIFNAISIDKNVNARIRAAATTLKQQIKAAREGK